MEELIEKLVKVFGPSSREDKVKNLIKEELKKCECEISIDKFGNLIAHIPQNGPKLMLASHLDTIGFIITDVDKNGLIRFTSIGGLRTSFLLGSRVLFENGILGTIYYDDRENLWEPKEFKIEKYFIDIGAKSKKDALNLVSIGMEGIFYPQFFLNGDRIISPSLDDRSGCAVLVELLKNVKKKSLKYDLYAVFTVQEEVGVKGARTSTYEITPDFGIAVDVTTAGDFLDPHINALELGKGPAIKVMDGGMITNTDLRNELVNIARKNNIPYQLEVITGGTTDAFAMQITKEGVKTAAISIPTRYVHTQGELADINDIKNTVALLKNFIEK
ncbi:M42 family metallopeptidase [Caldisericum exile]|uniref:N-terminal deblocking aminopeptidase n=1 Tax=Caldisericum exile (strain DSM 21853 / NBRC 104410 / AZM16c01) TaxID=511051 RepID=A0A7U6GET1_CALEA|nr:M42 family metallopeptidase [Caldisericum exile]BAL81058.1 N-terminal deblocking aminopeptidase [Caldisericum exile AZM16c01]